MGLVSYGQGGYVGASMSVRAKTAYESGEMPMSKWTRSAIISAIKDYCFDFDLAYNSDIESMSRAEQMHSRSVSGAMQAAFSPTRRFTQRNVRAFWRSAANAR